MKPIFRSLYYFSFWIVCWHLVSIFLIADDSIFPSIDLIARRGAALLVDADFLGHIGMSLFRLISAVSIAFPLAIFVAFALFFLGPKGRFLKAFFVFTYPIPKVAILPFALLVFGIGSAAKVFLIGLGIFYLVYFNTQQGITYLFKHELHEMIKVYRVPWPRRIWQYYFKGCLPFIFSGLRTGFGYGLSLVVVSEINMSTNGLGFFIWNAWDQFRVIDMYVGLAILAFFGVLINSLFGLLERVTWLKEDRSINPQ